MKKLIAILAAAAALTLPAAALAATPHPTSTVPTYTTMDNTVVPSVELPTGVRYYASPPPTGHGYVRVFATNLSYTVWVQYSVAEDNGWYTEQGNGTFPYVLVALGVGLFSLMMLANRKFMRKPAPPSE